MDCDEEHLLSDEGPDRDLRMRFTHLVHCHVRKPNHSAHGARWSELVQKLWCDVAFDHRIFSCAKLHQLWPDCGLRRAMECSFEPLRSHNYAEQSLPTRSSFVGMDLPLVWSGAPE